MKELEKLIAESEFGSADIKAAVASFQEEQNKKKIENLKAQLVMVQRNIDAAVQVVRNARKQEKAALARLKVLNDAKTQFLKDGDVEKYNKTVRDY